MLDEVNVKNGRTQFTWASRWLIFVGLCLVYLFFPRNKKLHTFDEDLQPPLLSFGNERGSYTFIESTWKPLSNSAYCQKKHLAQRMWEQEFLLRVFSTGSCFLSPFLGCLVCGWHRPCASFSLLCGDQ